LRLEIALHDPLLERGFKRFGNLRPMGTATILTAWPSLLPLILVTSPTSNGTSLGVSCPSRRAAQMVEGVR
jgi:hypothetical protein